VATPLDWYNLRQLRTQGFSAHQRSTSLGSVHWLEARGGGEDTLVLVHGLGARGTHYRRLCIALLPHVKRLILPDLPGHGHSHLPEDAYTTAAIQAGLEEFLDEVLIDEPAVLYGNSLGGRAVLQYGARRPDRVRGLVVTSPAGGRARTMSVEEVAESFRVKSHADAVAFTDRVFSRPVPLKHAVARLVWAQLREPSVRLLIERTGEHDILPPEELRALKPPTLFVWGGAEKILPYEHLEYFQTHLPEHVRFEHPEHYGHSAYAEHPEDLAARLIDFKRSLRA